MSELTVLCADPDEDVRDRVATRLSDELGMETVSVASVKETREVVSSRELDCVVTEYEFPEGSGLDLVDHIRTVSPDTPCILFTGVPPTDLDTSNFEGLIVEYLSKDAPDRYGRLGQLVQDMWMHRSQVGYLLPENETERLEALEEFDVDNLEFQETAERISSLVASHFDVPVAFVGLVERTQERFVACHGADWDTLDREDTICTFNILDDEVMVVEDIREDHRFKNNENLASLGIRSYAGANMTTSEGNTIGSLCLIDYEPRTYTEREQAELRMFADEAVEQLELRRRLSERSGVET